MAEPLPAPPELSPGASELLDAWLRSRQPDLAAEPPDVAALVRYQVGALGAEEARKVEAALVGFPLSRGRLKTTKDELRRLRAQPWAEVAKQAGDESLRGEVARAWMALTAASVESAVTAKQSWRAQGWAAVRAQAAEGVGAAKVAWASFLSFGDQLRFAVQAAPFATARSGSEALAHLEGATPSGAAGAVDAHIDRDGTLIVALSIHDATGDKCTALDSSTVFLDLNANGQTWPLAAAVVGGDRAVWMLPGIGPALGLAAGPLPTPLFRLTVGAPQELPAGTTKRLLAEILDAERRTIGRVPVPIEIHDGPHWEAGKFYATIRIAGPVRRAYAGHNLQLDVAVAGTARQCLGYWPLSDWSDVPRAVTAECPGSPDATVPYAAILHATLQP